MKIEFITESVAFCLVKPSMNENTNKKAFYELRVLSLLAFGEEVGGEV